MASPAGSPRVLVVDDEPVVRDVLTRYLAHEGFEVDAAADGYAALTAIEAQPPSVIVLDLMLPKLSGLELLRLVRLESSVPVIILSAKVSERERIAGLELGADDYVTKPYSPREVVARVRAVLRRGNGEPRAPLEFDDGMVIDPVRREVSRGGAVVRTTRKEFDLLLCLASNPGRVYTRAELVESVWGYVWSGDTETVTVHIRRLRAKIEADPSKPRRLVTVHGVGYRFEA
jgi:DNA-binding response OmpR family regulator